MDGDGCTGNSKPKPRDDEVEASRHDSDPENGLYFHLFISSAFKPDTSELDNLQAEHKDLED